MPATTNTASNASYLINATISSDWYVLRMTALPIKVAPKNVQNGIRKCPQQTPHKSKATFGQEAIINIPQKP